MRRGPGTTQLKDLRPAFVNDGKALHCDCPCGTEDCFLYIPFKNPLNGGEPNNDGHVLWARTGDTFETLTLMPSICRTGGCKWHGFITNGVAHL